MMRKKINWKLMLIRILVNGIALAITAFLLPNISVPPGNRLLSYFILGATLGILNATVKPLIQFFTLSFLFVTYGLVIIFINATILVILSWIWSDLLIINGLFPAIAGGALMGVITLVLDIIFGLTPPIANDVSQKSTEPGINLKDLIDRMRHEEVEA